MSISVVHTMLRACVVLFLLSQGAVANTQPTTSAVTVAPVAESAEDVSAEYWSRELPMHPKMVHVPMALCILMPMIAMLIWFGVRRSWFTPRVWLIAAVLQGATLAGGLAALNSGQDDGEKVEGYASEQALSTHESRAYWFLYVAGGNLVLCGVTFLLQRDRYRQQILGAVAIAGLFAGSYAGYRVGDAGGRLVYVGNATDAHR